MRRFRISSGRARVLAVALVVAVAGAGCAAAQAMRRGYQINTADMTCDEANRTVQKALEDMDMTITDFRMAKPGAPGFARAERDGSRGSLSGTVTTRCEADGVHIEADQSGIATGQEFERGVFLSVIGRANLEVEREGRYSTGTLRKREARVETGTAADTTGGGSAPAARGTGVKVIVEPLVGFATVLDFEANVYAAGILPVKITITNSTGRSYDFDPQDIALRKAGARERVRPMTPRQAVDRLLGRNRDVVAAGGAQPSDDVGPADASSSSELGDVAAASRIIPERALEPSRLGAGASTSGFLYFPVAEYDQARVTMTDVATGETEGFIVEF